MLRIAKPEEPCKNPVLQLLLCCRWQEALGFDTWYGSESGRRLLVAAVRVAGVRACSRWSMGPSILLVHSRMCFTREPVLRQLCLLVRAVVCPCCSRHSPCVLLQKGSGRTMPLAVHRHVFQGPLLDMCSCPPGFYLCLVYVAGPHRSAAP